MARQDFQATWIPRVGQEATDALRSYKHASVLPLAMCVVAGAAGLAFGGNTLDNLVGTVLTVATLGLFAVFIRSKRRFAEALSRWFGVSIKSGQLPAMTPQRFDDWREKRGLRTPDERFGDSQAEQSLDPAS